MRIIRCLLGARRRLTLGFTQAQALLVHLAHKFTVRGTSRQPPPIFTWAICLLGHDRFEPFDIRLARDSKVNSVIAFSFLSVLVRPFYHTANCPVKKSGCEPWPWSRLSVATDFPSINLSKFQLLTLNYSPPKRERTGQRPSLHRRLRMSVTFKERQMCSPLNNVAGENRLYSHGQARLEFHGPRQSLDRLDSMLPEHCKRRSSL